MPWAVTEPRVADLRKQKTFPFAAGPQAACAFTAKSVGERFLLFSRVTKDHRAELAVVTVIHTKDLFPLRHCLFE